MLAKYDQSNVKNIKLTNLYKLHINFLCKWKKKTNLEKHPFPVMYFQCKNLK